VRNNPGPGGPNWGTVTAEDDPPSPSRCYGGSTGRIFFSIAVQRATRNEHKGTCHSVHAVRPGEARTKTSFHASADLECVGLVSTVNNFCAASDSESGPLRPSTTNAALA
jgi:hypothetical protein